jgi:mono/diheme cytochrome c family protein
MSKIATSLLKVMMLVGLMMIVVTNITAKKQPAAAPSGRDIYMDRCGACHGEDAKGNGPAVGSLRIAPADLTLLAKRNQGTFPIERVKKIVGDWVDINAHGSREMPIWGDLFHPKNAADQQVANNHFKSLVAYLESIQE